MYVSHLLHLRYDFHYCLQFELISLHMNSNSHLNTTQKVSSPLNNDNFKTKNINKIWFRTLIVYTNKLKFVRKSEQLIMSCLSEHTPMAKW